MSHTTEGPRKEFINEGDLWIQPWMRGGWEMSGRCRGSAVVMPFNAQNPICLCCDPAVSMGLLKRLTHCTEHGRLRTNRCWEDLFIYFIVQLCVRFKTKDVQWFMSNNDSQRIEINSQNSPRVLDLFFYLLNNYIYIYNLATMTKKSKGLFWITV